MEPDQIKEIVKKYYAECGEGEWERLVRHPYRKLEFDTTLHFLNQYLPDDGLVLDAGGGPGRYSIELAKMGYNVTLLDLTPRLLQIAHEKVTEASLGNRVKEILQGSIDDLSMFEKDTFDAVVCLGGALSHLVIDRQRKKGVNELVRVVKQGAPLLVSVIGKLAVCMNTIVYLWPELESAPEVYRRYTLTGDYFGGSGFAPTHFYTPEELEAEFRGETEILEMAGLEGMFSTHEKEYNEVYRMGKYNKILWETHLKTCTHPSIVGISEHFMIICRKK
ncbi:MAG: class I SAM-dependent methyltransferase [Candidatus Bathyarchaeota archaeon]|nr:MAG: class I SAM-dependent methyltransferase [Candidatus Bathyarchaeota archaeon]